jgi:hypothetical protein
LDVSLIEKEEEEEIEDVLMEEEEIGTRAIARYHERSQRWRDRESEKAVREKAVLYDVNSCPFYISDLSYIHKGVDIYK